MIELDHAESIWNRAVVADQHGDPFCCRTEWQLSFYESISPGRPLRVRAHDGSVVAFAERVIQDVPVLEPIDNSWLFGSTLIGPDAVPMLRELMAEHPEHAVIVSGLQEGGARGPGAGPRVRRDPPDLPGERRDRVHRVSPRRRPRRLLVAAVGQAPPRSAERRAARRGAGRHLRAPRPAHRSQSATRSMRACSPSKRAAGRASAAAAWPRSRRARSTA